MPALNAAIHDTSAAPPLFELVATLVDLRDEVRASQWLRPHLPLWRTADTLIGRLTDVARHYLLACAAPTPLQAQTAAEAGQQALDAAADDSGDLAERIDRWERITASEHVGDIIAALAVETYRLAGTSDLLVLEEAGAQDFEQLLGSACPRGMGFLLLFMSLQAEVTLDQERFRRIARDAHALLTQRPGRLQQLVQDDVLVADMQDAARRGYDAAITAQAVLAAASNDRQAIRAPWRRSRSSAAGRRRPEGRHRPDTDTTPPPRRRSMAHCSAPAARPARGASRSGAWQRLRGSSRSPRQPPTAQAQPRLL